MKKIKVLGTGCANCKTTTKLVEAVAAAKGVEIELEKVEDILKIMAFNVMATPAVVVDGLVVHAGGIPAQSKVESWFL